MKRKTTNQRALAIRKAHSARKRQRGFAMEWIIIVLLVAAALFGLLIVFSGSLQNMLSYIIGTTTENSPEGTKAQSEGYNAGQDKVKGALKTAQDGAGNVATVEGGSGEQLSQSAE